MAPGAALMAAGHPAAGALTMMGGGLVGALGGTAAAEKLMGPKRTLAHYKHLLATGNLDPEDTATVKEVIKDLRGQAKKAEVDVPGNVTYDGDVNNGESSDPGWPRAAMGVDSAGRRATDSEEKKQDDKATPQHVTPKTAFFKSAKRSQTVGEATATGAGLGMGAGLGAGAVLGRTVPQRILGAAGFGAGGLLAGAGLGNAAGRVVDAVRSKSKKQKTSALSDAKQEKGLGKAVKGLAHSKMDPDQKAALAKGLGKAIEKEKAESDPAKFSSVQTVKDILSGGASRTIRKGREKEKKSGLIGAVEKTAKKDKKKSKTPASAIGSAAFGPIGAGIGGYIEGKRQGEGLGGAVRGAGGSIAGGTLGGGVGQTLGTMIGHGLGGQEGANIGAAGGRLLGAVGGGATGAHLATRKYRKDD